ncbi:acyltransferase family protein [Sphingomonas sp.]|uniref:acyltransferase family protein n=1 Tax=Sphingomonas sp. TaxID=28214 RepID=UPI001B01457E|nr:acyltransferase family protein [Sphingomonas sp.]MBO9714962.1 acyltransferase [Sphingomonas sp.]
MTGHPPRTSLGYIPAIDGLRALAVVSVVVFHLWPRALPGGFTGVDIFFVISGFVVTASMEGRRFESLGGLAAHFYARRLMRIMPALAAMLLVTIFAANLFIPDAWLSRAMMASGVAAFFGGSNIALALDSDTYFGPQAAYNPFTHTWSLGVEEQFYLLFPLLIHWHQRLKGEAISARRMLVLTAGLSLGSLALAAALSGMHALAFYLIFPRFWELGAGMLLCLTAERWRPWLARSNGSARAALVILSLVMVMRGLTIPEGPNFPFPLALLPVLGTAGLIAVVVALPGNPFARMLAWQPVVAIGLLSYSLYLWHWPVFVLFRWTSGLGTLPLQLLALAIAVGLAVLSYRLVEKPLRTSSRVAALPRGSVVWRALGALCLTGLAGTGLFLAHDRLTLSVTRDHAAWYAEGSGETLYPALVHCAVAESVERFHGGKITSWTPSSCKTPVAGFTVYAIGDSHNLAYAPAYRQFAAELGAPVRSFFRSGCPFLKLNDAVPVNGSCSGYPQLLLGELRRRLKPGDVVFLPGLRLVRFTNQFEGDRAVEHPAPPSVSATSLAEARTAIATLASMGARVVFEAPKPIFRSPPFRCSDWFNRANPICEGGLTMPRAELEALRAPVLGAMRRLAGAQPALAVWDPFPLLCPGAVCKAAPDGRPLFFDGDHLSGAGNAAVYPGLRDALLAAQRLFGNSRKSEFRGGASPLPLPATHRILSLGGREGERAGTAMRREAHFQTVSQR